MIEKGYKILLVFDKIGKHKRLTSYTDNGMITHYRQNQMVFPYLGCGPFAVFDTIEHSVKFMLDFVVWKQTDKERMDILKKGNDRFRVGLFEVEFERAGDIKNLYYAKEYVDVEAEDCKRYMNALKFEFQIASMSFSKGLYQCPTGTIFASGVKVLKEVEF